MNILVVQESDWIKRNPHQQHHLMERLSLKGHRIRVIDYPIDWRDEDGIYQKREVIENYYKIYPEANVDVIRPSILKLPVLVYSSIIFSHLREIKHQIRVFRPDIIMGFGIINSYIASYIAKKENIPFIYYWIDVLHHLIPEKRFQTLGKYLEKITIRNSTQVITINHKLEEFVRNFGAKNTRVIGAGIDLNKFDPTLDGSQIRKKYGIKDNDTVLFFMGFLYHFAGLKEVALALANGEYANLKFLIVGDGNAYSDIQNIVEKYDLNDKILLTGRMPYNEIPNYIAASDICILPAYPDEEIMQDIVPIKLYEYMAMGKPVIATTLPGIMKEFGHDKGIIYVNRSEEVIEKVLELSNESFKILGRKARNFMVKNNWNNIVIDFEKIILDIATVGE